MASSLFTVCPHCQKKTKIKDPGMNGKKARCPKCEQPFQIKLRKAKPRPAPTEPEPVAAKSDDDWMSTLDEFQQSGDGFSAGEFAEPPPRVGANQSYYSEANDAGSESAKPKKKKKKKSSRSSSGGFGLGPLGWVLGGSIAGVIGALIWGGITYASGYEVGWIAWGIGGMVGFGVLLGAGSDAGQASGLVAIAISVVSIFLGKFFAVWMMISALVSSQGGVDSISTAAIMGEIGFAAVFETLGPLDLLWVLLAGATAFRVGSNDTED